MLKRVAFCLGVLVVCFGTGLVHTQGFADDPHPEKGSSTKPAEQERRKPLPAHYGQIGISEDQRAQIYAVQDTYEVKLEKLRAELKALVSERDQKMEALLTPGQKTRLKELRATARQKSAGKASAAKDPEK